MLQTFEAVIDEQGKVHLVEPIQLPTARRALVTVLEDESAVGVPATALPGEGATYGEETLQQREREADELLALCDAAAGMWGGEFDAAQEIRQMRQERDEQIWLSKS